MSDNYFTEAFHQICKEAVQANKSVFVCLMEKIPFYGGPEEGGWWGADYILQSYQEFPNEEIANQIVEKVFKLAQELNQEAQKQYGDQCLRDIKWLEARGLDANFLPEPDGPSEYFILVTKDIPQNVYGSRHYE